METLEDLLSDELLIKIHEIIAKQDPDKEGITTKDILKTIDKQLKLSKDEYRNMDNKIIYRINKTQALLLEKFEEFKQTDEFNKLTNNVEALSYYGLKDSSLDNNEYYGILNSGIYTQEELDKILIEQTIFDKFILNLEEKYGINLLLPDRNNHWVRPRLVDVDQYGYKLYTRQVRGLVTLGEGVYKNGKYLGVTPDKKREMQYHTESLLELITPQKREEAQENE